MRVYLDTNMFVFILLKSEDDISREVNDILTDYSTILYTSSIALQELIFLLRIGKIDLKIYSNLQICSGHKDLNDHLIISQAISDRVSLISSDAKFKQYTSQGLNFIYNRR